MSAKSSYKINAQNLRKALEGRGYTLAGASRKMGRNEGFISNILTRGYTNMGAIVGIEQILKVPPDEFLEKDEQEEPTKDKDVLFKENELYRVIYCAVLAALDAWGNA